MNNNNNNNNETDDTDDDDGPEDFGQFENDEDSLEETEHEAYF